jgi:hypothetical protein
VSEEFDGVAEGFVAFGDSFETLVNGHVVSPL